MVTVKNGKYCNYLKVIMRGKRIKSNANVEHCN